MELKSFLWGPRVHLPSTTSAPNEQIIEVSGPHSLLWAMGTHLLPKTAGPWLGTQGWGETNGEFARTRENFAS